MADDFSDAAQPVGVSAFSPGKGALARQSDAANPIGVAAFHPAAGRGLGRIEDAAPGGGGSPTPPPVVIECLNVGWCTDHNRNETWITSGAPGPEPGDGTTHHILVGSQSYTILP